MTSDTAKGQGLPLEFRSREVAEILRLLSASESCLVIGVGSVGKSNFIRFLQREDVRRYHLPGLADPFLFAYIDVNKLLKQNFWGLMELMLHQLVIEVKNQGLGQAEAVKALEKLHNRATDPRTRSLTLRYLDHAFALVCGQLGRRLVFLIDEFDDLCRKLRPRDFSALRALRDDHKESLMYVVATRIELSRLRQDGVEIEAFEELLSPNTVWLGPYSEIDARFMLGRLAGRRGQAPDEVAANRILISTGGHPGLLRTVFQLACDWPEDFENAISTDWRLQEECRRIWRSLDPDDQLVLLSLAHGENVPLASMDALRRKGLVGGPWARSGQIFSSLFAAFLREEHPVAGLHIHLDEQNRTVWVDGRKVQSLTRLEYHLISYLVKKRGEICTRDELAAHLYPEDMLPEGDSVSETRIDSLVKRLRKKIEPDPDNPHYLLTVRGHGLRLNDGGG